MNNKKGDYPAFRLKGILINLVLFFIFLLLLIAIKYKPYYAFYIKDEFIGYYQSYEDYENTYNAINKEKYENDILVTSYLTTQPNYKLVWIKQKAIKDVNNYKLIENQMTKDYTLYQIIVNDELQFYTKSEEEANKIIEGLKDKVKESTKIEIQKTITQNLSVIESEGQINEKTNNIIEKNKKEVTSRSGITRQTTKNSSYIWPVSSRTITSYFGQRSRDYHTGLDIAVNTGSSVRAMMSGTVILAQWNGGYGYQVKIQHSNGIITTYAHNSKLLVSNGQVITQGEEIAKSGSTGNSTGPHLHIEFIINGQFQNPLNYL